MIAYRLAVATSVATFILLVVGGSVHATGSSLACPDWPLCYGQVFPEMEGGVLYEHTHRLVASLVGLMTIALAVSVWRTPARRLGLALVGIVVLQGLLGGITVIFLLPTLVSTAHLALSMAFFLLLLHACFRLKPGMPEPTGGGRGVRLVAVAVVATYAQVVLGGLVRHVGAGRACGTDVPTCLGQWWPPGAAQQLHQVHRAAGVLVLLIILAASWAAAAQARRQGNGFALATALAAPVMAACQVALGVMTVTSGVGVVEVVAHLGMAAALLGALHVTHESLARGPAAGLEDTLDGRLAAATGT